MLYDDDDGLDRPSIDSSKKSERQEQQKHGTIPGKRLYTKTKFRAPLIIGTKKQKTVQFFPKEFRRVIRSIHGSYSYSNTAAAAAAAVRSVLGRRSNQSPGGRSLTLGPPCHRDPADFAQRAKRRQAQGNPRFVPRADASNAPHHICTGRFFEAINLKILQPDILCTR